MTLMRIPVLVGITLVLALLPGLAVAHPLGNFTVNRYARLEPSADSVALRFVLDMAEIPAFQELARLGAADGALAAPVEAAYLRERTEEIRRQLRLSVDGVEVPLRVDRSALTLPLGQGGLRTLRLEVDLAGALPPSATAGARSVVYEDAGGTERLGWKEIVVRPAPGATVEASDAPPDDLTDELRVYPDSMLQAPLNRQAARFTYRALPANTNAPVASGPSQAWAGSIAPAAAFGTAFGQGRETLDSLARAELSVPFLLTALLAAAGFGAMHALSPGHGKTVVAAYLVGSRGTTTHALVLGLTVTATHTWAVLALGLATLYAGQLVAVEQLYPWLSLGSGLAVVALGLGLLRGRIATARHAADRHHHHHDHQHHHDHGHDHHHDHDHHAHDHEHPAGAGLVHRHGPFIHSHVPAADVGWRGLIALGIVGGLLPCPSALLLMLASISVGRIGLGLALVIAFSAGLAAVLTGIGLLLVCARGLVERLAEARPRRTLPLPLRAAVRFVPVGSALAVTLAGVLISSRAVPELLARWGL